jgi:hypothetical protein
MAPVLSIVTWPKGMLIPPHAAPRMSGAMFTVAPDCVTDVFVGHETDWPSSGKLIVVKPE